MADQAFKFLIRDIPDGFSDSELALHSGGLDLAGAVLLSGSASIQWTKNEFFIEARISVDAELELVCDRSLDPFNHPVHADYKVVFRPDAEDLSDELSASRPFSDGGTHVDLTQDIRDTLMLQIPIQPIHPRYFNSDGHVVDFETVRFGGTDDPAPQASNDPRWDKLRSLQSAH